MSIKALVALSAGTAFIGFLPGGALAQTSDDQAEATAQVEDIVVTAQRREERLQDVPVAVTAVGHEQLAAVGVQTALDFRIAAPSLNSTNASGFFASSIRGVGSLAFASGVESPVAVYVDGIYLAAPQASELTLNSVSSVEILKGPQGTLFGRNATGGLINIITATPTSVSKAEFSASYGNYDSLTGRAYLSGGLTDDLAADIAFTGRRRDGFGRNITTGAEVGGIDHDISVRSKMVWNIGVDTQVTLIGSYWDGADTNGYPVAFPGKRSGFIPGRVGVDRSYDDESNISLARSGWTATGAIKLMHDFESASFLSVTSYRKGTTRWVQDLDYTAIQAAGLDAVQKDSQISQEFQLASQGNSRLKWTVGLFYFDLSSRYGNVVDLSAVPGVNAALDAGGEESGTSYAGYGQATYELLPNTNLTLGGRYTSETRKDLDGFIIVSIPGLGPLPRNAYPDRSAKFRRFTYRASLDHRFSDQFMGYLSYNTGFKSGGFNAGTPAAPPYRPEALKAAEIGVKTDLLDKRLRINVSGFHYDYKNLQVQKLDLFSLFLTNGASARVWGVDADVTATIGQNLTLTGGFAWLDPKFKSFPGCPISQPGGGVPLTTGSCAGNQLPFAAKFSGSLAATYKTDVQDGELSATGNLYYNSGQAFEPDNSTKQGSYAKVGASVKWMSEKGLWVEAYGRNLTNQRTVALSFTQASGNVSAYWADPREYGLTIGYSF